MFIVPPPQWLSPGAAPDFCHLRQLALALALGATGWSLPAQEVQWHDARSLAVEGQAFTKTAAPYDRLPARAQSTVRPKVWELSRQSAGLCVRFRSDSSVLHARWQLTTKRRSMSHMPSTGVSGVDLYAWHEGSWRWLAVGRPAKDPVTTTRLVAKLPKGSREYLLFLPLYNGVAKVEIGIAQGAQITAGKPPKHKAPVVFYGTSITQGACASRPGMCHTAILRRRLDRPMINLGFSGNGTMDASVGALLAEIPAAVFVIDCLPNMNPKLVAARTAPLVKQLRKKHANTPILLVEDRSYPDGFLLAGRRNHNARLRGALRKAFRELSTEGVPGLHLLAGESLLGRDGDATVDGSHPTDLGFTRQAAAFERMLRPLLRGR